MAPYDPTWMVGRRIRDVTFAAPESWFFTFEGSGVISAECPWRIIDKECITVSSDDHCQRFGLPAPIDAAEKASGLLSNIAVSRCEIRDATADLVLDFDKGLRLEIIQLSSGYEAWQISDPFGNSVIAQGGGNIVQFPNSTSRS
jgi:hypothetical protein